MNIIIHEANGLQIGQRHQDGYINLSKMAQANGKLIADYLRLDTTKDFLAKLSGYMGIPIDQLLIKITKGANNQRGTWGHPRVSIHCGQWCSSEFAVLVSQWVFDWLTTYQSPIQSAQPSLESSVAKAYMESTQALNRVIHTAIHQQSNSIRDAIEAINHQNTTPVVQSIQPITAQSTANILSVVDDLSNSRSRRQKGSGSGYIYWRVYKGKYKQAFYHYELWRNSDRHIKSSKYIPKKLVAEIQRLDAQKAPVTQILKLLGTD